MLLAYKLKWDFFQNLPKIQISHPDKTDAFISFRASTQISEVDLTSLWHKYNFSAISLASKK